MYDVPPHSSSSAAASARPSPECERRPPLGPADCLLRPAQSPAHGARRLGYEEQLPHQRIARPARRRRRRSNAVQRVLLQKHAPARPRLDEQADASLRLHEERIGVGRRRPSGVGVHDEGDEERLARLAVAVVAELLHPAAAVREGGRIGIHVPLKGGAFAKNGSLHRVGAPRPTPRRCRRRPRWRRRTCTRARRRAARSEACAPGGTRGRERRAFVMNTPRSARDVRWRAAYSEHRVNTRGASTVDTAEYGRRQRSTSPLERWWEYSVRF
mmetsp:Transcript_5476/g.17624  ORF Transcript_5476/g.17624 Transcript_5476/m.17624 type:complete len:271 (+) Transcript_5476:56-868(+)